MAWSPENKQNAINQILSRISEGESVRKILGSDRDKIVFPDKSEFYSWLNEDAELVNQYARACEERADLMAEDTLNIADQFGDDTITMPDGNIVENARVIARDRLRVDTRKWLLSKLHPKKYGERISQELTGANGKDLFNQMTESELSVKIKELEMRLTK